MAPWKAHLEGVKKFVGYLKHTAMMNPRILVNTDSADHENYGEVVFND